MNVGYSWTFGPPAGGPPAIGVFVGGAGAAPEVRTFDQPARYRIGVFRARAEPDQPRQLHRLQRRR